MPDTADAVVIGAGIVGTSIAYLLAKEGLQVCILEKESIGSGSTGHGHGVISLVGKDFKRGAHFELGVAGAQVYRQFAEDLLEESGIDPLYHELDGLSFAINEEEEQIFKAFMERSDTRRLVEMRWINVDECRELEPRLTSDAIGGVLYRHGQVDGYRVALAAVSALERRGGKVLGREAIGLTRKGRRVVNVKHQHGQIACENVIIASGAWSRAAEHWIRFPIPVRPFHGEVLHARLRGAPMRIFVLTARHGPILPRRDGVLMIGSIGGVTMSGRDVDKTHVFDPTDPTPVEFDGQPKEQSREYMIECATRIMPAVQEAELIAHLAGVRPLSADRMPIIGPVPNLDNVYLATGHGTKGIHLAPITGKIITDLIVRKQTESPSSLAPFLPERFAFVDVA